MRKTKLFESQNFESWRLITFMGIIILVFAFFAIRLFSLQIIDGEDYVTRADDNRIETINTSTSRGVIYDRNGYVLARNVASYNVSITPASLPADEGEIQEIYRELSQLIDVPVNNGDITDETTVKNFKECDTDLGITQIVYIGDTNAPYDPVPIKCDVDGETALKIEQKSTDWPGVSIEINSVRDYPTGKLTAEIIGFLGPVPESLKDEYEAQGFVSNRDKVGYAGVEFTLQDELGGTNGTREVEIDVAGQLIRDLQPPVAPIPGNNVRLTIDTRLQSVAEEALVSEMNYWNTKFNEIKMTNGVVIAMNPRTGEVLALVSYPSFENNRMARYIPGDYYEQLTKDPARPLFNQAVSSELPPGSVYKMAAAVGALNEGIVTANETLECPDAGKITIVQKYTPNDPGTPRDYVCWQKTGHGMVDFEHAIANSCDVYFYKISGGFEDEVPQGLGIWYMSEYAKVLGYGEKTGIELPGEAAGLVPDPNWKRVTVGENWATGDTYITAMGQGYVLSTPLQVLDSFNILANDGKFMRPTLVKEILDSEGNVIKSFEPEQIWDITKDPMITVYDERNFPTEEKKVVDPSVIEHSKAGMRLTVLEGTSETIFAGMEIPTAGKTGTAEYCDNVAQSKNLCKPGNWPAHAWYAGYAPYDDPEISVVAFVYNGTEGSTVSAPIVRKVMEAYFELKAIDAGEQTGP